ncbi:MAG: hypothetical protein PHC46_05095 [Clostridia bacterium]|nr:hypothetical protein [Clostridia bacterium]
MEYTAENIRDGIFALNTRRFGTVAENLIKILANADWGKNLSHDLYDKSSLQRIEVKFSRALKSSPSTIDEMNIIEQIVSADDKSRMIKSNEWESSKFDCNIQQVKRTAFDILYYGIFFSDKVMIFKIQSEEIGKEIQYSDKQHRGNLGEGQFHLNNRTYNHHLKNHLEKELTYKEILDLLMKLQSSDQKKNSTISRFLFLLF